MHDPISCTLVTGASSGLGESFARQLAARHQNLVITARSGDKLRALATELTSHHGIKVAVLDLDLGVPGGASDLCAAVDELGVQVDGLISNAGFGTAGPVAESDFPRQVDMVRLNCEALVGLTTHFLPAMLARKHGGIIHLASTAGFQPVPYMATYGATKAFVLSYSQALAQEVRGSGVRVMALCPGPVATGFQAAAGSRIMPSQKAAVLSSDETVRRALLAWDRGATVCIPGAVNKMMTWASLVTPNWMLVPSVARMMKSKKAD